MLLPKTRDHPSLGIVGWCPILTEWQPQTALSLPQGPMVQTSPLQDGLLWSHWWFCLVLIVEETAAVSVLSPVLWEELVFLDVGWEVSFESQTLLPSSHSSMSLKGHLFLYDGASNGSHSSAWALLALRQPANPPGCARGTSQPPEKRGPEAGGSWPSRTTPSTGLCLLTMSPSASGREVDGGNWSSLLISRASFQAVPYFRPYLSGNFFISLLFQAH